MTDLGNSRGKEADIYISVVNNERNEWSRRESWPGISLQRGRLLETLCNYGIILFRRCDVGDCRCRCDILASREARGVSDVQIGSKVKGPQT